MTSEVLKAVKNGMVALGLNYAFIEWKSEPVYPYFVGEYTESPSTTEDGLQECDFILTGWTRNSYEELETAKEKIENYFNKISGHTVIANNGNAVAIFYENSLVVPTGEAELKKIEIHLNVKEWKVN